MKNPLYYIFSVTLLCVFYSCSKDYNDTIAESDSAKIEILGVEYSVESIKKKIGKELAIDTEKLIFNREKQVFTHADYDFTYSPEFILNLK